MSDWCTCKPSHSQKVCIEADCSNKFIEKRIKAKIYKQIVHHWDSIIIFLKLKNQKLHFRKQNRLVLTHLIIMDILVSRNSIVSLWVLRSLDIGPGRQQWTVTGKSPCLLWSYTPFRLWNLDPVADSQFGQFGDNPGVLAVNRKGTYILCKISISHDSQASAILNIFQKDHKLFSQSLLFSAPYKCEHKSSTFLTAQNIFFKATAVLWKLCFHKMP